ncbi:MAG: histidine kinase, partial [Treponema sp.]|nr:histidine kinase [Treponema sp.]
MRTLSGLGHSLFVIGLLLFLCGCVGVSSKQALRQGFFIDLNSYPLYAKNGFDPADTDGFPDILDMADGSWQVRRPEERKGAATVKSLELVESSRPFFLSLFKERDREYTLAIPFTVSPEQFKLINGKETLQPGIFLAALGDNWEIFLNGALIKSEMHLDEDGQARSGRSWRYIALPLDRIFLVPGTNILVFRIIGAPYSNTTGLWYKQPYYIDEYQTILKDHNEYPIIAICAVYVFVGLYHFLLFLSRPKDRYNLYYCFFSIFLGIYFLMRSNIIFSFIPNTNIVFRLENISLYMLLPVLSFFLEGLSFGKTLKSNKVFFWISLVLAFAQLVFYETFGGIILYIWQRFVLVEFVYLFGYDTLYLFFRNVRERQRADKENSRVKIFFTTLSETPQGNILICASIMSFAASVDIVNSILTGHGIVKASPYAIFLFILTTTIIFTQRFGRLFRQVDEMNILLEKSNLNLETTVQERTRELERQTHAAEAASRSKSDFLARMSHEIRTPLNAVIGMSELALQDSSGPALPEYLANIRQAGSNLLSIINDVLDLSKIEAGGFQLTIIPYWLSSLINNVINVIRVRFHEKPVLFLANVDAQIPNNLLGDEVRIRQILFNVLNNAVKYTEEGFIKLTVTGTFEENHTIALKFEVADSGIGIRKTDMKELFGNFTRLDLERNRAIEGTGLGLAITKRLCHEMGGEITVSSEYGKGSTFTVRLPQEYTAEDPVAVVENPGRKPVLFYDERPLYADSVCATLANLGVSVSRQDEGEAFLAALGTGSYPFAFVSSGLVERAVAAAGEREGGTRLVLLADLEETASFQGIPVILMPAYAVPVANLLNGVRVEQGGRKSLVRFTAPGVRVLIVDDIMTNLKVAQGLLSAYRMQVDICDNG